MYALNGAFSAYFYPYFAVCFAKNNTHMRMYGYFLTKSKK